jgi:hypothetical protein
MVKAIIKIREEDDGQAHIFIGRYGHILQKRAIKPNEPLIILVQCYETPQEVKNLIHMDSFKIDNCFYEVPKEYVIFDGCTAAFELEPRILEIEVQTPASWPPNLVSKAASQIYKTALGAYKTFLGKEKPRRGYA